MMEAMPMSAMTITTMSTASIVVLPFDMGGHAQLNHGGHKA